MPARKIQPDQRCKHHHQRTGADIILPGIGFLDQAEVSQGFELNRCDDLPAQHNDLPRLVFLGDRLHRIPRCLFGCLRQLLAIHAVGRDKSCHQFRDDAGLGFIQGKADQ